MADPYATIDRIPEHVQEGIADAMVARSLEPAQIAMRRSYLDTIDFPECARAADLGGGTGHLARDLAEIYGAAEVLCLDFSPVMVDRARALHRDVAAMAFQQGDARDTGLPDAHFDVVVLHTVLCHVPEPERAIAEAFRILRPGGTLAVFDGDYDTVTVATCKNDPLHSLVQWFARGNVHDLWLTRRLSRLLPEAGLVIDRTRAHAYLAEGDATYFRTIIDRGADFMEKSGLISPDLAAGLRAEVDARIAAKTFFGFISYLSFVAHKPG